MITTNILVNGRPVKQYTYQGNTYIEAREGTTYSIKINNLSHFKRLLAVITVDGLNVINGLPQDNNVGQGYIIDYGGILEVKGFRESANTVGAFKFCKRSASYCNERGLKGNNGVIGVRIYDEKIPVPIMVNDTWIDTTKTTPEAKEWYKEWYKDWITYRTNTTLDEPLYKGQISSSTSSLSIDKPDMLCCTTPDFDLGTTWGEKINDATVLTTFEACEVPSYEHIIYYDTRTNLEKIGISFKEIKHISQAPMPKAFNVYAKPPKGWK